MIYLLFIHIDARGGGGVLKGRVGPNLAPTPVGGTRCGQGHPPSHLTDRRLPSHVGVV